MAELYEPETLACRDEIKTERQCRLTDFLPAIQRKNLCIAPSMNYSVRLLELIDTSRLGRQAALVFALAACLLAGCATYADNLAIVRQEFVTGDLAKAKAAVEKGKRRRCDRDVLSLDQSILLLAEGKPKESEQGLRQIRDHFGPPGTNGRSAKAAFDADRRQAARLITGEDYEKVLVRVFLALSNLMSDGGDAGAYCLQVADKQQQIIAAGTAADGNNPKLAYQRVAFGAYLHGALREETHSNYDDVQRAATMVCSWQPNFPFGNQDLDRARHGHHSAPGNGVLYVIALAGVGPHKEEAIELPSTVSLLIADRILSAVGNQTLPPTIAPIKVPKVILTPHDVGSIGVSVDGVMTGRTATITDVGRMAVQQYEAIYPHVIAQAVVRRIVKKGVVYGAKEVMGTKRDSLEGFGLDMLGVAWEASESADTRCWGLLPDTIQVLRLELPAGTHQVTFQSLANSGYPLGRTVTESVTIVNGRNTYVMGNFPYGNLIGSMLTSQH